MTGYHGGYPGSAHLCAAHLSALGHRLLSSAPDELTVAAGGGAAVAVTVDRAGAGIDRLDEVTAQAACGLMAVHGRASGAPARLGVDYVTTAAGVVAAHGALAALLSGLRGQPVPQVTASLPGAALLTVSQYLAAGSADDPEHRERFDRPGTPPPFESADGVRFELETLDPEPWRRLWLALGVEPSAVAQGWRAFVLRYATAFSPIPAAVHAAASARPFAEVRAAAEQAGVAVQPLRSLGERLADPRPAAPWLVTPTAPVDLLATAGATLPLSGLRVVEAGRRIQGPLAGHVLRLLGAEVVRIEPAGGDPLRGMPPMVGDCSARFLALNRGKRIVEVDLRSAAGRDTVRQAVAGADVFLHNWAPGKAGAFGLDSDDFTTVNPGLVYVYASGWGPARGDNPPPGTDFVAQAYTGLGEQLRPPGRPAAGSLMTLLDVLGGLVAAEGALAGLLARQLTGHGQRVDSSLLSAAGVLQAPLFAAGTPDRAPWQPLDSPLPVADGYVAVTANTPGGVIAELDRPLPELGADDAVKQLRAAGVDAVRVCTDPGDLAADPQWRDLIEVDGCAFVRPPWRFTG